METAEAFSLISQAIDSGKAAHGYLLCGDLGGSCAELTDMILEKLFPDAIEQVKGKIHPDIIYLMPKGAKRIIKVEDMREKIVTPMAQTSYSGGWKVGVIVGADRMEAPSANCFLKSLEEPTPKTLYLLLTDQPDGLLPTIVSRSQRVDLPRSEGIYEGEDLEEISDAFARKDAEGLTKILGRLKEEAPDEETPQVRKRFYRTLMSFVRKLMLSGKLPRYRAFANVDAVEVAYRQSEKSMGDEMVISLMLDKMLFPK